MNKVRGELKASGQFTSRSLAPSQCSVFGRSPRYKADVNRSRLAAHYRKILMTQPVPHDDADDVFGSTGVMPRKRGKA